MSSTTSAEEPETNRERKQAGVEIEMKADEKLSQVEILCALLQTERFQHHHVCIPVCLLVSPEFTKHSHALCLFPCGLVGVCVYVSVCVRAFACVCVCVCV